MKNTLHFAKSAFLITLLVLSLFIVGCNSQEAQSTTPTGKANAGEVPPEQKSALEKEGQMPAAPK